MKKKFRCAACKKRVRTKRGRWSSNLAVRHINPNTGKFCGCSSVEEAPE